MSRGLVSVLSTEMLQKQKQYPKKLSFSEDPSSILEKGKRSGKVQGIFLSSMKAEFPGLASEGTASSKMFTVNWFLETNLVFTF